jgi:iron complex transport system substrate-binding protein
MSRPIPRLRSPLALLAVPVLALAVGCGSSGSTTSSASTQSASQSAAAYPVTVQGANGPVTIKAEPKRMVSLSPADTEILWAIGAGSQVVAVDDQSDYPPGVPTTKLSSYKPNAEAIAGYNPDLVVISNDQNGVVGALAKLKIPTLLLTAPQTLDESYAQFETLGKATGHEPQAAKQAQAVKNRIAAAVASVPKPTKQLSVYHELEQDYYSATSKTFIGSIYSLFGLKNIADAAKGADNGYPQLSAEYVVQQAPDLIVLADTKCCGQTPETVAKRPAFGTVPAVKNNKIVPADDDIVSRWGPRTADFAELVAKELNGQ